MNAIRNARNIFVAMLLVLMSSVVQSQQIFSADFKGTPEFFSVSLTPPQECIGNLYVVASFPQLGFVAYTGQNRYVPYRGGEIPAFEGTANAAGTFLLVSGVNVRQSEEQSCMLDAEPRRTKCSEATGGGAF